MSTKKSVLEVIVAGLIFVTIFFALEPVMSSDSMKQILCDINGNKPVVSSWATPATLEPGLREIAVSSVNASSTADGKGEKSFEAEKMVDGARDTYWQTDHDVANLEFNFGEEKQLKYIYIFIGNGKSGKKYNNDGRPSVLELTINAEEYFVSLNDTGELQCIELKNIITDQIVIRTDSLFEGKNKNICISEIIFAE